MRQVERHTGTENKWWPGTASPLDGARLGGQSVRGTRDRVETP